MTAYDDNNTGVLFVNERKTKEDQPDFTGSITMDGEKIQLAAWKRRAREGKKAYIRLKLTVPSSADKPKTYATQQNEPPPPRDEDIF